MALTNYPVADTERRMGRPPLKRDHVTKPTMVRLTDDTRRRIEAVAGENRMAAFIREAVEEKLASAERQLPRRSPDPKG